MNGKGSDMRFVFDEIDDDHPEDFLLTIIPWDAATKQRDTRLSLSSNT
jgi:hypothetical protein